MVRAVLLSVWSGTGEVLGERCEVGREGVVAGISDQAGEAGDQGHQEQEGRHGSYSSPESFLPLVAGKTLCIDFLPELF
jgi:hypothetical protein